MNQGQERKWDKVYSFHEGTVPKACREDRGYLHLLPQWNLQLPHRWYWKNQDCEVRNAVEHTSRFPDGVDIETAAIDPRHPSLLARAAGKDC